MRRREGEGDLNAISPSSSSLTLRGGEGEGEGGEGGRRGTKLELISHSPFPRSSHSPALRAQERERGKKIKFGSSSLPPLLHAEKKRGRGENYGGQKMMTITVTCRNAEAGSGRWFFLVWESHVETFPTRQTSRQILSRFYLAKLLQPKLTCLL